MNITHTEATSLLDLSAKDIDSLVASGVLPKAVDNAYPLLDVVRAYITHLREKQLRGGGRVTQAEIAAHLDISERRLRELLTEWGVDHRHASMDDLRVRYLRKLREEAAGRAAGGDLDLAGERALLARAQRQGQEIKNQVALGTYASIELLSDVLANAAQSVVDRLDQIPADLRRVCPDLPQAARDAVMTEIASARNEMVRKTASLVADSLDPDDILDDDALEGQGEA